jgi:hypothetical protein
MMAVPDDDALTASCGALDVRADIVGRISRRRFGNPFYEWVT